MAKKKIALDCGHGLKTAGKQTPNGIKEWELNDKVRDKIVDNLKDYDVEFVFTDNDEGIVDEGLTARRTMYINAKVDAAVSIHHNAYTGTWNNATGVEVYVDKKATAKDRELAELIYNNMVSYLGMVGRGIKEADWTVIDQNEIPAVLTEGGFMDGIEDYKIITTDEGQSKYAKAISDALIVFLKLEKKKEEVKEEPKPTTSFVLGQKVKLNKGATYTSGKIPKSWVYDKELYVRKINGDKIVISTLETGAVTGEVFAKDLTPIGVSSKPTPAPTPTKPFEPYMVRIDVSEIYDHCLNIREKPDGGSKLMKTITEDMSVTIVEEAKDEDGYTWGLLLGYSKYRNGWIRLDYTTIVQQQ